MEWRTNSIKLKKTWWITNLKRNSPRKNKVLNIIISHRYQEESKKEMERHFINEIEQIKKEDNIA